MVTNPEFPFHLLINLSMACIVIRPSHLLERGYFINKELLIRSKVALRPRCTAQERKNDLFDQKENHACGNYLLDSRGAKVEGICTASTCIGGDTSLKHVLSFIH
mmetsp:Transcript_10787/g.18914  ORF Transcript_10787/g.18914 Transcript_10787/m.18914 type:complete len:105 (+) Transcript_10787:223-537(+)